MSPQEFEQSIVCLHAPADITAADARDAAAMLLASARRDDLAALAIVRGARCGGCLSICCAWLGWTVCQLGGVDLEELLSEAVRQMTWDL